MYMMFAKWLGQLFQQSDIMVLSEFGSDIKIVSRFLIETSPFNLLAFGIRISLNYFIMIADHK